MGKFTLFMSQFPFLLFSSLSPFLYAESNYFPRIETRKVIKIVKKRKLRQKSVNLPILSSFKAVKTKFMKIKSMGIICSCVEL